MENILRVLWTIEAKDSPQPLRHCSRCNRACPYRSSGKFRLNANGRRIDAWLIYKCTVCAATWNRPLLERRSITSVAPALLKALERNDPALVRRLEGDVADLRRHGAAVEETRDSHLRKEVVFQSGGTVQGLEIRLAVPLPTALRLDRLLVRELGLSRKRLQALCTDGRLALRPDGPRALRRAVRDGTCIRLDLSREPAAAALAARAGPG